MPIHPSPKAEGELIVIRPQFRLRTLFVLVAIAAVPCTLLAWKMDRKRRERAAVTAIRELGGEVVYDYEAAFFHGLHNEPPGPVWLRRIFGDDFFAEVDDVVFYGSTQLRDDDLAHFGPLTSVRSLRLSGTAITDAGLNHIRWFKDLDLLYLEGTRITDAGVGELDRLPKLAYLRIDANDVTDEGLRRLGLLTKDRPRNNFRDSGHMIH
jgi:hypothetical protein